MAAIVILLALAFALAILPQMWVRGVLKRHSVERPDLAGTGGEFARHLLDAMKLAHVKVEETTLGDHYDPEAKIVRLSPQHFGGRSLSAIVVAAHEIGHAMQDATGYGPLAARTRLAKQAQNIERLGMAVMLATPLVVLVFKSPYVIIPPSVVADPIYIPDFTMNDLSACPQARGWLYGAEAIVYGHIY